MFSGRPSVLSYLLPRLEDVLFVALFLAVIGLGPRLLNIDGDLGRHLTIGEHILQTRSIPTRDIFSHTLADQSLTPHEWLAQVSYAVAYRLLGLDGVVWLCALLIAATFTLAYHQAVQRSGLRIVSLGWVILAAGAASLHWLARPHLFTLLLVVLWTGELERMRNGEVARWWRLPILMWLWANLHGAFIAGFVIGGAYVVDYAWRRWLKPDTSSIPPGLGRALALAAITSTLATLLNPSGLDLWVTSVGYVTNRYLVGHTAEYLPPNFQQASAWPFLLMIALSLLLLASAKAQLPIVSAVLLAGWTALGLYSVRNVPLYALIAAPILAEANALSLRAAPTWQRREDRLAGVERSLRGHAWPVVSVALVVTLLANGTPLDFARRGNRFDPAVFPVQAVDWLQANPLPGRMFNYFTWGGYLLHRLWPQQKVFIDGQTDFYGEAFTRQYEQVITLADGWQDVLRQYQVDWALMPDGSVLARALQADPDWQVAYHDETAIILVHAP